MMLCLNMKKRTVNIEKPMKGMSTDQPKMPWFLPSSLLKKGKKRIMEALVPSWARPEKSIAASTITRVRPISSCVRQSVNTKKVVKKPIATPR